MTQDPAIDAQPAGRASFTREQLYQLVWSKPISQISGTLGLSGVGLAKLCARNNIPTPPRGHWAKKRSGKAVRQMPLPKAPQGSPDAFVVTGPPAGAMAADLVERDNGRASRVGFYRLASAPRADSQVLATSTTMGSKPHFSRRTCR